MDPVFLSVASVILVSLVSFVGILALSLKEETLQNVLLYFVAFSAGALFGDSFLHLLPEVVEVSGFGVMTSLYILAGVIVFFIVEKFIHWHHCHLPGSKPHPHSFAYMNLFGDAVHNFIDGMVIAASYLVSTPVGIATTLAVIFHEIPQEIGDFGVLLHGGFTKKKAIMLNFVSAVASIIGAVTAIFISQYVGDSITMLAAFAAGGFIYVAGSDLIPQLHKKFTTTSAVLQVIAILLGIFVMYALLSIG